MQEVQQVLADASSGPDAVRQQQLVAAGRDWLQRLEAYLSLSGAGAAGGVNWFPRLPILFAALPKHMLSSCTMLVQDRYRLLCHFTVPVPVVLFLYFEWIYTGGGSTGGLSEVLAEIDSDRQLGEAEVDSWERQ